MPTPDYTVTIQILTMLRMLERSGRRALPVRTLAEQLEVHPRTVKRWAEALAGAIDNEDGQPLVRRELRQGQAWVVLPRAGPPLSATVFQYACAWAAVSHLGGPGGSLLSDVAGELVGQVQDALPARLQPLVDRVPTAFCTVPFAPKDYRAHEDTLDTVVGAVLRKRRLRLRYRNLAGRRSHQKLDPYTVVMYRESLYVLGRVAWMEADSLRTFAIDRIEHAELVRDEGFELPEGFEPGAAFAAVLGLWRTDAPAEEVRLRFVPEVVDVVAERCWTGFRSLERHEDGSAVLSLDLPVTPELRTWILSWGPEVEVLGPPTLRALIGADLARAAARYG